VDENIIKIICIGLGVLIPVIGILFSQVIKDRDAKTSLLFKKHDEVTEKIEEIMKQMATMEEKMRWLEKGKNGQGHL
jgi:hypothetical protein